MLLRARVPAGWPHFPEAYSAAGLGLDGKEKDTSPWGTYLFLLRDGSALVGSGGYKGGPTAGRVEVGYEIAPEFQNHGYATEATRAMISLAFAHPEVEFVQAHTLTERNSSTSVLEKLGISRVDTINDPDEGAIWRWSVARPDWPVSQ